jgi:EmrB/QacA subfamily drug resistance transporter
VTAEATPPVRTAAEPATELPHRWAAAAVLIAATLMDLIDATIVNVALPTIQRDLRASPAELEWTSAAYLLAFAAALVTMARLGDLRGRKRVFLTAVAVFCASSLLCALARSPAELIAFRAVQGLAAAGIAPQALATVQATFSGRDRGTVFGLFGIAGGLAQALGVTLGGVLTAANLAGLGWRTIFLVNVPIAVALIVSGARVVPETRVPGATRPGLLAAIALAAGLSAAVFPLLEGRSYGWPAWCWPCLAAGVITLAALALAEARRRPGGTQPLLPTELFRIRSFSAGLGVQLLAFGGYSGFMLTYTLWLQDGQGYTPLRTGLVTLAFSAGSLPAALAVGGLTARFGRNLLAAGCALFAVGALGVLAAAQAAHGSVPAWSLLPGLLVLGAAINLIMPPLGILVLSAAPPRHAGTASGILSTTQQFGGALGIAVVGAVFFAQPPGGGRTTAFTASAAAVAAILAVSAALSLTLPRPKVKKPPESA